MMFFIKKRTTLFIAILLFGVIGCAAGSLFVFKGKYRAVVINYPSFEEKYSILTNPLKISN